MTTRQVHAIQINLRSPQTTYVIIWPNETREPCLKLLNSKHTWLTARAGDIVLLKREKSVEWDRYSIESVSLFRVFPVEFIGTIVECVQTWIDVAG